MIKAIQKIAQTDSLGGVLLVAAALLALLIANSTLAPLYNTLLSIPVIIKFGAFEIAKPLVLWVNDGLMAIFFFLIGLEIKRELLEGNLATREQVILPGIAAVAGIIVPAAVYLWFNQGDTVAMRGWAIPSATDIAFALGILSLFGRHVPVSLKIFLMCVAIFDDIGAILIIALFYSQELSMTSLIVAAVGLTALFAINRFSVRSEAAYVLLSILVWSAVLKSGVHATLAGFAVALFIPLRSANKSTPSMLLNMEHALHPWVAFGILPMFAFFNAGINLTGITMADLLNPMTLGIALGLFVGKQIGIFGACWLTVKIGVAKLPANTNWMQIYGVSLLCGIGFTMSLFIGSLAFEQHGALYLNNVKISVLLGSLLSAILGSYVIAKSCSADPIRETKYEPA